MHFPLQEQPSPEGEEEDLSVNAMVLSAQFWPAFREEKVELPGSMKKVLEKYTSAFEALKGNRTLSWKPHLGQLKVQQVSSLCFVFLNH